MEFESTEVFQAILNNDIDILRHHLIHHSAGNLRGRDGRSYLHVAADQGSDDVIFLELLSHVDISLRDESSSNVLDLAISKGECHVQKMILQKMLDVLCNGSFTQIENLITQGWSMWPSEFCSIPGIKEEIVPLLKDIQSLWEKINDLHSAILIERSGPISCESCLVAESADVTGLRPLHKATILNRTHHVQYLINKFPHVLNLQDYLGRTALHYSVVMEDQHITQMLLQAGAQDHIKDVNHHTAVTYQEFPHLISIPDIQRHIKFILHKPQKLQFFDPLTFEIFDPPVKEDFRDDLTESESKRDQSKIKHIKTIVTLLRMQQVKSVSSHQLEIFEDTVLYEAIIINDVEEVKFLINHGHNAQCRSLEGQTYLHLAVTQNVSLEIIQLLLSIIDISLHDSDGHTALDLAIYEHVSMDILACLLDYVVNLLINEDFTRLEEMAQRAWTHWPPGSTNIYFTTKTIEFLKQTHNIQQDVEDLHNLILDGEEDISHLVTDQTVRYWDRMGLTSLDKAVIANNIHCIELILDAVPDVINCTDNLSRSALHYAACIEDHVLYNMLLYKYHGDGNIPDTWGFTAKDYKFHPSLINIPNLNYHIQMTCKRCPIIVSEEYWYNVLQTYGYIQVKGMDDCKLYHAIKDNNVDDVNKLLADGEDTKLRNENGDTLLHVVVKQNGSLDIFKAFISKISDTSLLVRNEVGQTVYDLVVSSDYVSEAGDVLKEAVWSWGVQGGWERLQAIAAKGWDAWLYSTKQAAEKSKEDGEYMNKIEKFQEEVNKLHSAIMEGNEEVVQKFLDEGNVTLLTSADRTGTLPLQKAVIFQQILIINLFLDSKHKEEILDAVDNMKRTACHYAGGCHDAGQIYSMLQEAGADESIKDLVGKLPSDYHNNPLELSVMEVKKRISAILTPEDETDTSELCPQQEVENKPVTDTTQSTETIDKVSDSQSDSAYKPLTPSTPSTRKPIQMYISSDIYEKKDVPPPVTVDGRYIARHLGTALTSALAEIAECRPWDPIEYLAHWLIKYRKNLDYNKSQEDIMKDIRSEEAAMDEEEELRAKRLEEERQIQEAEEKQRREKEEEERKIREQDEELQKKAKEAALLQKPLLPTVTEELEEDTMYKERDERGQTELHKLAAQEGADLVALFNLGYSLADRDGNNQTPRDIAEDHDIQENIDAMDSYISNMIEQEKLEALQQLLLDGYDKLGVVLSQVSTDGLPDEVTDFLKAVPDFQAKISQAFKAVESGVLRDVAQYLDRKKIALAKDIYGRSPLHIAVLIENKEIVEYIIKHYPTAVKCRDNLNRTPLHYASALSEEITNILTSTSADQQAKDVKDRIPEYYLTEKSEIQKIQIAFRTGKADNSDTTQTETESEQVAEQSKTETEQVTSATE